VKYLPILFIFFLSSCMVMPEEYFQPKAEGAIVERESCRGKVGADNQLVYELDNVNVNLDVWEHTGKGVTYIGIAFKVFDGGNVIWPDQVVQAYIDERKVNFSAKEFSRLRVVAGELITKEYPVNSIMEKTSSDESETYYESFQLTDKKVSEIRVQQIKVIINGKEQLLSDILFTKKSGVFLHPLNC
jgi:hypothetical protein